MSSNQAATDSSAHRRRASKRKKAVQQDPLKGKIGDALEHMIVTGAHIRHATRKRQRWEVEQQQQQDEEQSSTSATKKSSEAAYFAQDLRLYGGHEDWAGRSNLNPSENGYPMMPWPVIKKENCGQEESNNHKGLDGEWNLEYGDSIPPVLFSAARLCQDDGPPFNLSDGINNSNHPQNSLDWRSVPASTKSLQSTDISVPLEHVPQAMLERCWTRAVQAAASVMHIPVPPAINDATATAVTGSSMEETDHTHNLDQQRQQQHQDGDNPHCCQTEAKCKSLGIALENEQSTQCPRCTRDFSAAADLAVHYYGRASTTTTTTENGLTGEGCCQALVRQRQLQTINSILQHHVQSQTDQLLHLVLSQAALIRQQTSSRQRNKTTLEWNHVLSILEQYVANSTVMPQPTTETTQTATALHPVLQTMAITIDKSADNSPTLPLQLNPSVLQIVKHRLVDRYA